MNNSRFDSSADERWHVQNTGSQPDVGDDSTFEIVVKAPMVLEGAERSTWTGAPASPTGLSSPLVPFGYGGEQHNQAAMDFRGGELAFSPNRENSFCYLAVQAKRPEPSVGYSSLDDVLRRIVRPLRVVVTCSMLSTDLNRVGSWYEAFLPVSFDQGSDEGNELAAQLAQRGHRAPVLRSSPIELRHRFRVFPPKLSSARSSNEERRALEQELSSI